MMKLDPFLSKAARLAKKRDFDGALRTLKAEEDRYYGSFKYFYLYAVICLHAGSFGDALANFRQARQIKMKDPNTMLGLAVLYLKRADTVQAVDYYLDVQEIDSANKTAKNALAVIRKYPDTETLAEWLTPEKMAKFYPPIPSGAVDLKTVIKFSLIAAASLAVIFGVLVKLRATPSPFKSRARPSSEFVLSGQERSAPVETGGSYRYILTRDQAAGLYDRALSLFTSYRDETAKINLNRLMESNASQGLKNSARLLLNKIAEEVPGFDNFKRSDNVSYAEVKNEPVVYRDVYVIWNGMATNVEITDDYTRFDFLVGYDTRKTLEGIVPVVFDRPVAVNSERPLEVLGKIALTGSGASLDIRLDGAAIHQSGKLER